MGTSSMYGGPGGGPPRENPLLPPGFDPDAPDQPDPLPDEPPAPEEENNDERPDKKVDPDPPQGSWQSAKTSMAKFASGSTESAAGAVSAYVKAYGGAKTASKSMPAGVRTTINLNNFLTSVSATGIRETLQVYQVDYEGKSAAEILSQLIGVLAPAPVTREDSIARKALVLTMEQVYELVDENAIDILDVDADGLNFIVPCYIKSFVYQRLLNDLGSRIETANITAERAIEIETELRDYIDSKVDVVLKGKDFATTSFNQDEVERLYNQCYTAMEIMI